MGLGTALAVSKRAGKSVRKVGKEQHSPDMGLAALGHTSQGPYFQTMAAAECKHEALFDCVIVFDDSAEIYGELVKIRGYSEVHRCHFSLQDGPY